MGIFKKKQTSESENLSIIADYIVEDYRFMRSYQSVVDKLFSEEKKKYESAFIFHKNKIIEFAKKFKLKIIDFVGKNYDCGMPVAPLNADEFQENENLIIEQTIEPTIITEDGIVIRTGTIILAMIPEPEEKKTED